MLEIPEYGERKEGDEVMDQIRQDTYEDLVDLCDILESISIVSTSRVMANDDKCQIGRKSVQLKSLTSSVKFFSSSINAIYSLTNRSLIVVVCAISRGGMRPYSILTRLNALI